MAVLRAAFLSLSAVIAGSAGAQTAPPAAPPAAAPGAGAALQAGAAPSAPASPAPATTQRASRVGLGAAVGTGGLVPAIYVPIDAGPVRIEPEVGYFKSLTGDAEASATRLGLGLFGIAPTLPSMRAYGGVRAEYVRDEAAATIEAVRVAGAVGAEWAAVPAMALGVEGQVGYTAVSSSGSEASGLDVSAQVFLRVFLASASGPAQGSEARSAGSAGTPRSSPRLPRCTTTADCDSGICYEGYCRH